MTDRPYDDQSLMPKEFLLSVMRDKSVALTTRVRVAEELLKLWPERHHYTPPALIIRIEGLGNNMHDYEPEAEVHGHAVQ